MTFLGLRRLYSSLPAGLKPLQASPNVTTCPLLSHTSIPLSLPEKKPSIPLIPRTNPFLKPVQACLRNLQTLQPEAILQASPHILAAPFRPDIMHRVVVWHRAGLRQGTASSKGRSEVAGSSAKIRPQKGTGKARAGSSRAPQRRGGGRCFGPKPRDYSHSLPPKIRALGLRSALTSKFKQGQLTFVTEDSLQLPSHKTSLLASILEKIPIPASSKRKVLLLDTQPVPKNLQLASQSLQPQFKFMNIAEEKVNVYHVLDCNYLMMTPRALAHLQPWLEIGL